MFPLITTGITPFTSCCLGLKTKFQSQKCFENIHHRENKRVIQTKIFHLEATFWSLVKLVFGAFFQNIKWLGSGETFKTSKIICQQLFRPCVRVMIFDYWLEIRLYTQYTTLCVDKCNIILRLVSSGEWQNPTSNVLLLSLHGSLHHSIIYTQRE